MSVGDFLPILGVLLGTILGALLTYFVQNAIQNKAWKREIANKRIDTIYAPLYRDVLSVPSVVNSYWTSPAAISGIKAEKWDEINSSESKLFIDKSLYDLLQGLYTDLKSYQKNCDALYRSSYRIIRNYFASLVEEPDAKKVDGVVGTLYSYFSTLLYNDMPTFRGQFSDEENYVSYMSNIKGQIEGQLKAVKGQAAAQDYSLPQEFLEELRNKIQSQDDFDAAKKRRDELIRSSERISRKLEDYIMKSLRGNVDLAS